MVDGGWSAGVTRLAVWLGGQVSFEDAATILSDVGQIYVSGSSVWRRVERWGQRLVDLEAAECARANAVPARDEPVLGPALHDQRMGIAMDGWLVNIREEGWKEVKTGVVFEVGIRRGRDEVTGETLDHPTAQACSYVAHVGEPEPFGEKLWTEAVRREVPAARETQLVADAAAWIWNLGQDYFPDALQVVDWYHAQQHLWAVATLLHGPDTPEAHRWVAAQATRLYQGHAARVAQTIDHLVPHHSTVAPDLQREATFFARNQRRMAYLEYREEGWPIGSGMIEGGCKQFQARLKGPGMRWSRPGAERMVALRASILSQRFDHHWAALQKSPLN